LSGGERVATPPGIVQESASRSVPVRVTQSTVSDATPKLGAALRQRHVTMIALGGIIGAGLRLFPWLSHAMAIAMVGVPAATGYLSPIGEQAMEGRK
jgi:AAT family amino acid transporter/GABA permease